MTSETQTRGIHTSKRRDEELAELLEGSELGLGSFYFVFLTRVTKGIVELEESSAP